MQNIVTDLNSLQQQLEKLQAKEQRQIEEFKFVKNSIAHRLSPAQLFKQAMRKVSPAPAPNQTNLHLITGIIAGGVIRRLYAPKSSGLLRKLTAPMLQFLVTNFVKNKLAQSKSRQSKLQHLR
jgi:hypothetical protein